MGLLNDMICLFVCLYFIFLQTCIYVFILSLVIHSLTSPHNHQKQHPNNTQAASKIATKTAPNCTKNSTKIVSNYTKNSTQNNTQTAPETAPKQHPNCTQNSTQTTPKTAPKLHQKQHPNNTQTTPKTTPKQHPNCTKNNTQTTPKTATKQHPNCTENSHQKQPKLHWKQPQNNHQNDIKNAPSMPMLSPLTTLVVIGPSPPLPNPLSSVAGAMMSLHSLSHAKNAPNPNWVLVSGLPLAPHELGPTPTNFSNFKTTLNIFFIFQKNIKYKNFGSLILGYFLFFVFLLLRSIFHIYSCFTKKCVLFS